MFKMRYLNLLLTLCFVSKVNGQIVIQDSLQLTDALKEVVVTANKFSENKAYLSQHIELLDSQYLSKTFISNTADMLEQSGKVFVQRSQLGGGSPVLRGFEASRVLLMVDGVRMNNAIYRTGHLQNVITIDEDLIEKVEVLYGPSSTLYGSDALGGVIHLQTKKPKLSESKKLILKGGLSGRYSSASNENSGNLWLNAGNDKFAALTSISYSNYGDLRQGNIRSPYNDTFGKRYHYITKINGIDSVMKNSDPNRQIYSGYSQFDFLQKLLWQRTPDQTHELNFQFSTSSDVPRYDRLTDTRNGQLRWAEWYYGPQKRLMAGYTFKNEKMPFFFDKMIVNLSYQGIEESRMQRQYRRAELESRIEQIQIPAFSFDLRRDGRRHELNIGIDGQLNLLKSLAYKTNINTGIKDYNLDTRYPDGNNSMYYTGAYYQHLFKIIPQKLILNNGIRINHVNLNSNFIDTSILHLPFVEAKQKHWALSGNLGVVYLLNRKNKIAFNFSSGFRSPNIDDLAKVFESAGGVQVVIPNPNLKPEKTYNFDLTYNRRISDGFELNLTGFYTLFNNAIILDKFIFNGADSIFYNGQMTQVVANQNKSSAYIYGFQSNLNTNISSKLSLYSTLTYTYGRAKDLEGNILPLDHIPPVYGKTGIAYKHKKVFGEFFALYNGWKYIKDYNPYGEDNQQYATQEGMPAWYTLNVSLIYYFNNHFRIQAAIQNILDQNYRVFASGISGAGRNLIIKANFSF